MADWMSTSASVLKSDWSGLSPTGLVGFSSISSLKDDDDLHTLATSAARFPHSIRVLSRAASGYVCDTNVLGVFYFIEGHSHPIPRQPVG